MGIFIPYVFLYISVAFFPSLKHNFIAYGSSKVSSRPDCIFEIHELWQSDFSRVYSYCCCSCSFKPEIIKIYQSSHKMYCKNICAVVCWTNEIRFYDVTGIIVEITGILIHENRRNDQPPGCVILKCLYRALIRRSNDLNRTCMVDMSYI